MMAKTAKKKQRKKKIIPQNLISTDNIFNAILTGSYPPTQDRLVISKSLATLRGIELRKEEKAELALLNAYRQCREPILKTLIKAVVDNNLRLVDTQILLEMIAPEAVILSAWEYEHLDEADKLVAPVNGTNSTKSAAKSAMDMLKALDSGQCVDEDDEEDNK